MQGKYHCNATAELLQCTTECCRPFHAPDSDPKPCCNQWLTNYSDCLGFCFRAGARPEQEYVVSNCSGSSANQVWNQEPGILNGACQVGTLDGAREAMGKGLIDAWLWEKFTTKHLVDAGEPWIRLACCKVLLNDQSSPVLASCQSTV